MNQMREIDAKQGFNSHKKRHIVWMLEKFVSNNKKKANIDLQHKSEYLAGQVDFAANLCHQIDNTKTFRTPLPANKIIHLWYCLGCGDLDDDEVTNDKRCSLCGESLLRKAKYNGGRF